MSHNKGPRNSGKRVRWFLILLIASILPAVLLLQRSRAQQQGVPRGPRPDVVQMIGPVSQDRDLRDLPYIAPKPKNGVGVRRTRHPPREAEETGTARGARMMRGAEAAPRASGKLSRKAARKQSKTAKVSRPFQS